MLVTCPECGWEIESADGKVPLHHVYRVKGSHEYDQQICVCRCRGSGGKPADEQIRAEQR